MDQMIEVIIAHAARVFGVDKAKLCKDSTWVDDLHIDVTKSLQDRNFVDFKSALEEEFDVEIPNIKFGKTKTIADMALFIQELCEE